MSSIGSWYDRKKEDVGSGHDSSSFLSISDYFHDGGSSSGGFQLIGDDSATYYDFADSHMDTIPMDGCSKQGISFNQNIELVSPNGTRRVVTMNDSGGFYDCQQYEDLHAGAIGDDDESANSLSVSDIREDSVEATSTSGGGAPNEGTQPSSLPSSREIPSGGGDGGMVTVATSGMVSTSQSVVDRFTNSTNNTAVDDAQDDAQNAVRTLNALRSKQAALRDPSIRSSSSMSGGNGGGSCSSPAATQAAIAAAK